MNSAIIILAGATGDLGDRIARALVRRGATVRALMRADADPERRDRVAGTGAMPTPVDFGDVADLTRACQGGACVVSALSGLEEVILGVQGRLLEAAIAAGVPRFIPSDFSLDYTDLPLGSNRNFDLRRRFRDRINAAPIRATSIFNGAFADMLTGQMPLIQGGIHRVLYVGSADVKFPLTTKDDTAAFTAAAALDAQAPRDLHIAGGSVSSRDLAATMTSMTGRRYGLLPAGTLELLGGMIALTKRLAPQPNEVFPPWQGMQYLHNMFSGLAPAAPTDNGRYPGMTWTTPEMLLRRA